ncbi:hypothetical protein QR680_014349 [Steinernema hermaphroditum]|uniref:Uncharacterized protein n=1 Tax=Steinernema hermaphroditum TaxID=289476 RepID=A0AA39I8L8_9BILA|nr:hypothetical protein QR680_014349 [Steinernema hermaphroditum]
MMPIERLFTPASNQIYDGTDIAEFKYELVTNLRKAWKTAAEHAQKQRAIAKRQYDKTAKESEIKVDNGQITEDRAPSWKIFLTHLSAKASSHRFHSTNCGSENKVWGHTFFRGELSRLSCRKQRRHRGKRKTSYEHGKRRRTTKRRPTPEHTI